MTSEARRGSSRRVQLQPAHVVRNRLLQRPRHPPELIFQRCDVIAALPQRVRVGERGEVDGPTVVRRGGGCVVLREGGDGAESHLDICIAIIILNTKFIILNTKFIALNANRYLKLPVCDPCVVDLCLDSHRVNELHDVYEQ